MTILFYLHKLDIYITPWQLIKRWLKLPHYYGYEDNTGIHQKFWPEKKENHYIQLPNQQYFKITDYKEKLSKNKLN
jgi:hypothetical protein